MSDPLRAPEYLVALQDERDEMGRFPGALLARHSWRWYRRTRSVERGIALFDRRARLRIPPSDNVESPSDDDLAPRVPWEVE